MTWGVSGVWKGAFGLGVTLAAAWLAAPLFRDAPSDAEPPATT